MNSRGEGSAEPRWLEWMRRLGAIAQNGLAHASNPFDIERYEQVRDIAAEIGASHSTSDRVEVRRLFTAEAGYSTPKVDVRGAVFQDDRIVLVKERADGRWTLPGGWADVDESPAEAVAREVREESGYEVRPVKLLAVYDRRHHGHPPYPFAVYMLFFLCEAIGRGPAAGVETMAVQAFGENQLPELSLNRVTPVQVRRLFRHLRHPEWPTDFD